MADIVLKDVLGSDVTFTGIDTVKLKNTQGNEETFSLGVAVEKTLDVNFIDYSVVTAIDNEEAMDSLLEDASNVGMTIHYTGESGKYTNNCGYKVVDYEDFNADNCPATTVEVASNTALTTSIDCNVGDLIIAAFVIRSALVSLSDGWTLISTSQSATEINANGTNYQTLSLAYKYAANTTESLTVTQTTAGRIYLNMVAFSNAKGFADTDYQYQNNAEATDSTVATFNRPIGEIVVWALTRVMWNNSNYPIWTVSNDARTIQLGSETQSRLLLAIDTGEDETVTFTSAVANTTDAYICGALSIEMKLHFIALDTLPTAENQTIEEENVLFKKVIVAKPETLLPENIMQDINIAGIIGTAKKAVVKWGLFTGTGSPKTVNHNLGFKPDIILTWTAMLPPYSSSTYYILTAMGFTEAAAKACGIVYSITATYSRGTSSAYGNNQYVTTNTNTTDYIDGATGVINSANDSSFVVGNSTYNYASGNNVLWYAIGGLT